MQGLPLNFPYAEQLGNAGSKSRDGRVWDVSEALPLAIIRTESTLGPAAYPLAMMLQSRQKLELDAQAFIGVQL